MADRKLCNYYKHIKLDAFRTTLSLCFILFCYSEYVFECDILKKKKNIIIFLLVCCCWFWLCFKDWKHWIKAIMNFFFNAKVKENLFLMMTLMRIFALLSCLYYFLHIFNKFCNVSLLLYFSKNNLR